MTEIGADIAKTRQGNAATVVSVNAHTHKGYCTRSDDKQKPEEQRHHISLGIVGDWFPVDENRNDCIRVKNAFELYVSGLDYD